MEQKRWKSPVVWASVGSQVLTFLLMAGILDVAEGKLFELGLAIVLEVLTVFGVLNNPTMKGKF